MDTELANPTVIDKIRECDNDNQRWEIILANKNTLGILLDNDETSVIDIESGVSTYLDHYLGISLGVTDLLDLIGIELEFV